MAQALKCHSMLSLEEIALRRLVAVLWNDSDILVSVMQLRYPLRSVEELKSVSNRMKDKIMKLELPESLTKRMVDVVRPIGLEIRRWGDFHEKAFSFSCIEIFEQTSVKLYFTTAGAVDDRRMAQEIVRCNQINVVQRYQMACSYWLEDCIPILWKELTEEDKDYFYKKNIIARELEFSWLLICKDGQPSLYSYLRKSDTNLTSFNQWAFEHSAKKGFKTTAEYFFRKLSREEREASLMRSAYAACSAVRVVPYHAQRNPRNVLHYLLSLMTPEQQTEIVKALPVVVVSCFFEWPRRELFSENAGLIWSYLSPIHYKDLLQTLFSHDPYSHPEFFKQSPLDFKKCVTGSKSLSSGLAFLFLHVFFVSKDRECIELFFKSADVEARAKLVSDRHVLRLFYVSMARGKWRLVEACLREATLSTEDKKKLKETFLEYLTKGYFSDGHSSSPDAPRMNDGDPKLKSFFDFLDGTDASAGEGKKGQKRKNCSPERWTLSSAARRTKTRI